MQPNDSIIIVFACLQLHCIEQIRIGIENVQLSACIDIDYELWTMSMSMTVYDLS